VKLDDRVARAVAALVGASLRHARLVVALFAALTLAAGWVTVTRFELNSDVTQLFPQDLPWLLNERDMDVAFPDRIDVIAVVIDAPTGAAASRTAEALAQALRANLKRRKAPPPPRVPEPAPETGEKPPEKPA
jgi:predicted RND superfamily exporter protein